VAVHRYEVYEQIVRENEAARASGTISDESAPAPISAASVPRRSARG
jgi:sRNA-binding carbon storage regulator CsrA